ncbi:MAG: hypothetical protein MZV63_25365 [Marinilabiliales bacterium]|nr:hypothetical protein [Marinilabiliales bacterium]
MQQRQLDGSGRELDRFRDFIAVIGMANTLRGRLAVLSWQTEVNFVDHPLLTCLKRYGVTLKRNSDISFP